MKRTLMWLIVITISIALVSTFSLAGCKKEATGETTEETVEAETEEVETVEIEAEEETEEAPAEPITLTVWTSASQTNQMKDFLANFEKAQDKYKLDILIIPSPYEQTVLTKWASGDRPDILSFHSFETWLGQLQPDKNLLDLSDMEFVGRQLYDILEATTQRGDKIYGPCVNYPIVISYLYNIPLFEQAGITEIPTTHTELLEVAETLKVEGITPFFEAGGPQWPLQATPQIILASALKDSPWQTLMGNINTGKDDFTNEIFINAFMKYKEMYDAGYFNSDILSATYEQQQEEFFKGNAAIMSANSSLQITAFIGQYGEDAVNETVGVMSPSLDYTCTVSAPGVGDACWFVPDTGNADKIVGAKEFITFISGGAPYEQYYQEYINASGQPAMLEGFTTPELTKPFQALLEIYQQNDCPSFALETSVAYGAFETFLQEMIAGIKTPQQVGEALTQEFVKNAKAKGLEGFEDK